MEEKKEESLNVGKYLIYFVLYSFIGWFYEIFLEVVVYKWGYSDRGILFGPYCPVYGVGALTFIFTVYHLIKNKKGIKKYLYIPIVFLLCMMIATLIELITSYICEFFIGSWPWQTYANYKINFQARIALSPSIRFGIGGVVFLYVLQPLFEKICVKLGNKLVKIIAIILGIILLIDCFCTFKTTILEKKEIEKMVVNDSNNLNPMSEKGEQKFLIEGVWQYPDNIYPDEEIIIKSIENNLITFDYVIDGITSFENVEANLDENIAKFDIVNDGDWNIKGTMVFDDNSLTLNIRESSNEYIPETTTIFTVKSNKSVLQ